MPTRDKASVSVFDSGFVLGDGIWEGLRLVQGRLISLDDHMERLFEGATSIALDIGMTRDYLRHLRQSMGRAVEDFVPFEEAYARTDWSAFEHMPMYGFANRMNAYNTYLLLEEEALGQKKR